MRFSIGDGYGVMCSYNNKTARGSRKRPVGTAMTGKSGASHPPGKRRAFLLSSKKSREDLTERGEFFKIVG